ncbi:MAG TPA: TRAP transporter small permease [Thiolinea sp.]|nr:TRAP transporter small permease [Thiolinea sp.]
MSSASSPRPKSFFDEIEETSIAVCLGLMTLITFVNVVARYVFNANILWALETTVFLFAWLVLMGMSYGVKKHFHIGVDVVINLLGSSTRRWLALASVVACLAYSLLLLYGSWNYWYPFVTTRAFMETQDIPMPAFLQFLADWLNDGEKYEKLPRFLPYMALPLGLALLTFRFIQQAIRIWRGEIDTLIASHEAEEALEEVVAQQRGGK